MYALYPFDGDIEASKVAFYAESYALHITGCCSRENNEKLQKNPPREIRAARPAQTCTTDSLVVPLL